MLPTFAVNFAHGHIRVYSYVTNWPILNCMSRFILYWEIRESHSYSVFVQFLKSVCVCVFSFGTQSYWIQIIFRQIFVIHQWARNTILDESGPKSNGNEGPLPSHRNWRITIRCSLHPLFFGGGAPYCPCWEYNQFRPTVLYKFVCLLFFFF